MRYVDRKRRILMVDKVPCKCLYSVWLCYDDGSVMRTTVRELRSHNTRHDAEASLEAYARKNNYKRIF